MELTLFSCLRLVGVSASLAASVTVVNRFIDYWLHIGFGVLIWVLRKKIRLYTWREIPLENIPGVHSLKPLVGQEDFS